MGKKAKKSRKNRQKIDGKKDTSEEKTIEHSEVETSEPEEALHSVETSKQTKVDDSNDEVLPPTEEDENDGDEEKKDEDEEENLKEAQKKGMDEEEGDTNESRTSTKSIMESEHKEGSISDGKYRNKQRCLVVCSRGIIARYRHLLEDMRTLIPHHKKESKLDPPTSKGGFSSAINDMCQLRSCNSVLFLECRKRRDCYMWLGCTPSGPSARFHVTNIHTMDELRLTGNCMKGSRPVLTFDESFGRIPHLKLLKELFVRTLGTPRGHPKSKPFVDRVMGFYFADNKVRNKEVGLGIPMSMIIKLEMSVCLNSVMNDTINF